MGPTTPALLEVAHNDVVLANRYTPVAIRKVDLDQLPVAALPQGPDPNSGDCCFDRCRGAAVLEL
jgi:hypothetical protein